MKQWWKLAAMVLGGLVLSALPVLARLTPGGPCCRPCPPGCPLCGGC